MANKKWIDDLTARTAVTDAARQVLKARLEAVGEFVPLAVHEADKDPEYVHQLRVASRRARTALDIFSPCLPGKAYKKIKETLRNIRRAAGAARDWDVFLAALTDPRHEPGRRHRAGLDFLMGYALAERMQAQAHLEQTADENPLAFERFLAETLAAIAKPDAPELRALADLARPQLVGLVHELDRAGAAGFDDYAHLHQVRIIGKRLRYAMEVFAGCFALPFREKLYPRVEEMQEILGRANDSHVALGRLESLRAKLQGCFAASWKRFKPGIEGLHRFHRERLPQERQRFLEWWEHWRESRAEAALIGLLKTSHGPGP